MPETIPDAKTDFEAVGRFLDRLAELIPSTGTVTVAMSKYEPQVLIFSLSWRHANGRVADCRRHVDRTLVHLGVPAIVDQEIEITRRQIAEFNRAPQPAMPK